jgi:hypothetical protein
LFPIIYPFIQTWGVVVVFVVVVGFFGLFFVCLVFFMEGKCVMMGGVCLQWWATD